MLNGLRIGYHRLDIKLMRLMEYFGFKTSIILNILNFVYSRIPERLRSILNNWDYIDYSDFNTQRKYIQKMKSKKQKWIYK